MLINLKSIDDDVVINLSGKYEFVVTHDNIRNMEENSSLLVKWAWDDRKLKDQPKYVLTKELVLMLLRKARTVAIGKQVIGYTKLVITTSSGHTTSFYGHPCFLGREWYDWALVHFEEENQSGGSQERYYPSKVIGFIEIDGHQEAIILCSLEPLQWSNVQANFFVGITLENDIDISFVDALHTIGLLHIEVIEHNQCIHQIRHLADINMRNCTRRGFCRSPANRRGTFPGHNHP